MACLAVLGGLAPQLDPAVDAAAEFDDPFLYQKDVVLHKTPESDRVDGPVQLRESIEHHTLMRKITKTVGIKWPRKTLYFIYPKK